MPDVNPKSPHAYQPRPTAADHRRRTLGPHAGRPATATGADDAARRARDGNGERSSVARQASDDRRPRRSRPGDRRRTAARTNSAARGRGGDVVAAARWPTFADFAGWAEVVARGALVDCPPGLVVGALRANFAGGDRRVVDALARHVSQTIDRRLRRTIGTGHPNAGRDIIERAAGALLDAIFDPHSMDGDELVVAFAARVRYRAIDAARAEGLYQSRNLALVIDDEGEVRVPDGRDVAGTKSGEIAHLLGRIPDPRHRLAFKLHMEGMRISIGDPCVAGVLGCHPKTATRWIASARARLAAEFGGRA